MTYEILKINMQLGVEQNLQNIKEK